MTTENLTGSNHRVEALVNTDSQLLIAAEREVAAFLSAVLRSTDAEFAEQAGEYWMDALSRMDWPCEITEVCWRRVSIAAAAQLALSIDFLSRGLPERAPGRSLSELQPA